MKLKNTTQFSILIYFLTIPFYSLAQDSSGSKWSLGINASIDYNYRMLFVNIPNYGVNDVIFLRDGIEIPLLGISAGVNTKYQVTPKLDINVGTHYAQKGYQTNKRSVSMFQPSPSDPTAVKTTYNYTYLDFPFTIRYRIGKQKTMISVGGGVAWNLLIKSSENSAVYYNGYTNKTTREVTSMFNKSNTSGILFMGVSQQLSNKIMINIEPTLRYQLLKNINTPITERLYNVGLNITTFYRL